MVSARFKADRSSKTDLSDRTVARAAFDRLDKDELRQQLVVEQGWLCAFCMRRISETKRDACGEPTMKIAHRIPISYNPSYALTWTNLFGSCDGGQRSQKRYCTCDNSQQANALSVDPSQDGILTLLRYERRGEHQGLFLTSDVTAIRTDLENVLKLNEGDLPELRESAWKAFQYQTKNNLKFGYGKAAWRVFFPQWCSEPTGKLREFIGVIEKKIE